MLFTYACLDNYVKDGGRLGFIITQTLFKTKGAGDGFRRFQLGDGAHFKVFQVDDLSDFQPFEGATNRTAIVTFQKGRPTKYPVPYLYWQKKRLRRFITGGLNGVFWIEIPDQLKRNDGLILIRNLHNVGKTKVKQVEQAIEPDLIYRLFEDVTLTNGAGIVIATSFWLKTQRNASVLTKTG